MRIADWRSRSTSAGSVRSKGCVCQTFWALEPRKLERLGSTRIYAITQICTCLSPKSCITLTGNFHESLRSYSDIFRPGSQKVKGEITPGYSVIPMERIRFIRAIIPDVRLIFLIRNPIDRAWSQAFMNLVKLPNRQFEKVYESEFYAHFKAERSVRRGDYLTILNNWLSIFPREQMYIGFFENIANRPKDLLSKVFAHMGVSNDVDWTSFPYNKVIYKGPGIPIPQKYREFLAKMYCLEIESLHERFGGPIEAWLC